MRILLSAYACRPDRGSEPALGWNWARSLSRHGEVHVLTAARNRPSIESGSGPEPGGSPVFHFVPELVPAGVAGRLGLGWLLYYAWQWQAYRLAAKLHRERPFDISHHVTYGSWRVPSFLWKLDIPFVWGPVGGGQNPPPGFGGLLGVRGRLFQAWRRVWQSLSRLDPFLRLSCRLAAVILIANTATKTILPHVSRSKGRLMLGVGCEPGGQTLARKKRSPREPFRLLWISEMAAWKGLPLLLHALARIERPERPRVTIVGDGRERSRWQALATRLDLAECTTFSGHVSDARVREAFAEAHALVFTSLVETSGTVVLEGMAAGLAVIVLDWGGPAEMVAADSGMSIFPHFPEQVEVELAAAIQSLSADPERCRRLGEAAQQRVRSLLGWRRKARQAKDLYEEILRSDRNEAKEAPDRPYSAPTAAPSISR